MQVLWSELHKHVIVLYLKLEYSKAYIGFPGCLAGLWIILPAVPRANDFAVFNRALTQWAAPMRTHIVHCAYFAINVCYAYETSTGQKLFYFTWFRKVSSGSDLDECRFGLHLKMCPCAEFKVRILLETFS